ncbi:MAG: hypothetical protein V8Q57_08580 [Blautia sp.]
MFYRKISHNKVRCEFLSPRAFDWENETAPKLEYENMILNKATRAWL